MQNVTNLFETHDKMCKIKTETNIYIFVRKYCKLKNMSHKRSFHANNYSTSIVHSDALAVNSLLPAHRVWASTQNFKSSTRAKPALQRGSYSLVDLVSVSILAEKRPTIRQSPPFVVLCSTLPPPGFCPWVLVILFTRRSTEIPIYPTLHGNANFIARTIWELS